MDIKKQADLIVPVPSHPLDEIKRGYSHMSIICKHISRSTGIKNIEALKRMIFPIFKRGQKFKDRTQRLYGKKRFDLRVKPQTIQSKDIILIDDVTTTGATVAECAQVLLEYGAKSVQAICFALTRL